jgi:hypothetical protein
MPNPKVTVCLREVFRKTYYALKHEGEEDEKYYMTTSGELELEWDPEAGRFRPANAKPEYRQVIGKRVQARLKAFRKEFREYVRVYWDLVKPATTGSHSRNLNSRYNKVPERLGRLDVDKAELLKYIKNNSWVQRRDAKNDWEWVIATPDDCLKLWLERFTRTAYTVHRDEHDYVMVPLGEACPDPKY